MVRKSLAAAVVVCVLCMLLGVAGTVSAQPDSLTLQPVTNFFAVPQEAGDRAHFVHYLFWTGPPPSEGTFIHPADTLGWHQDSLTTPSNLAFPETGGAYLGTVDRTISFRALQGGTVGGLPSLLLRYDIVGEENFSGRVDAGSGYALGDSLKCIFTDTSVIPPDTLDLGLRVVFNSGVIDSNGTFLVGIEDFEGFHAWRGIQPDGSDLTVITELSKQENFTNVLFDSVYFQEVLPALRTTGVFTLPFGIPFIGRTIDIRNIHPNGVLGPNEFMWFDNNAFNGFTYYYAITTFDRDYNVRSTGQGLIKFDRCQPTEGVPFPCPDEMIEVETVVDAQNNPDPNDIRQIYAVPNPYRSGSSQFTTPNYHNFPDQTIRFVNLPSQCMLKIYTVAGDVVWQIDNDGPVGVIAWDTRNTSGEEVSSGTYIYKVETDGRDDLFGRVIIIR